MKQNVFKEDDLNMHYYFDNSHFTDIGSLKIAKEIANNLSLNQDKVNRKCKILNNNLN